MDVVVRNARLVDGRVVNLGVADGLYVAVCEDPIDAEPPLEIEAEGRLVTPSFVNAHLHLDKVYTLPLAGDAALASYTSDSMGEAMRSIAATRRGSRRTTRSSWIVPNARRALDGRSATEWRTCRRSPTSTPPPGWRRWRRCSRLREEYRELVDLQVVAFPQDGLLRDPGAEQLVREAMGSAPTWSAASPGSSGPTRDAAEHVDRVCRLAADQRHPRRDADRRRR